MLVGIFLRRGFFLGGLLEMYFPVYLILPPIVQKVEPSPLIIFSGSIE